jgi:hypothetical protein
MNINNLVFFDKNGESYNFSQNSETGSWEGSDYFLPISTALYDVSNLFILEKIGDNYRFPALEPGSKLTVKWKTAESSDNFFLFTIAKEDPHTDSTTYLTRQTSLDINYEDLSPGGFTDLDLAYPLQLNVGFSPSEEVSYNRILNIYYEIGSSSTLIASIYFYGEGEDEDERFRIWLANFGIKFNREDALLLKDYDLKEGLPDWKQINQARKQLLVNRDQIYPYVGTYKGLTNIINILGYRDVLRVKEYWQDQDTKSAYYGKYAMVDVTDLLNTGTIDNIDLVDLNGQIKKGGKFKKTEFLALAYEFSIASDIIDEDGIPEVEFTTDFTVDEIFYKLNRLSTKLKTEMLPINVVIKDIIGEFIYFNKFTVRQWSDVAYITELELNDDYNVTINHPSTKSQLLLIRDIKPLYPKLNGTSEFPEITFNQTSIYPYQDGQKYNITEMPDLITAISDYYEDINLYEFQLHGQINPTVSGDDIDGKVGCPITLESYIPDFTLSQLDGSKFIDFVDSHFTIGNIRYRNGYEMEWNITGPQGYVFNWRANLMDIIRIPHILPHIGDYIIQSTVYDLQGGQNVSYLHTTVLSEEPVIEVFTKLQDKPKYQIKDLHNITLGDIGDSPIYLPFANAVKGEAFTSSLAQHYLDWNTYSNNFGVGNPQTESQIFTEGIGFEQVSSSANPAKIQFGTGSSPYGQPTIYDYQNSTLGDLILNRLSDLEYTADRLNGFIIKLVEYSINPLIGINFYTDTIISSYVVSSYIDAVDLAAQLNNESVDLNIQEYRYVEVNGNIHAHAKRQDKALHRVLTLHYNGAPKFKEYVYTFSYPTLIYSNQLISTLNLQLSQIAKEIDEDLLFLNVPFEDCLRKTGETTYSMTVLTIPSVFTSFKTFTLTRAQEFIVGTTVRATSISNPGDWVEGIVTQSALLNSIIITFTNSSLTGNTRADWAFTYVETITNLKPTFAAAGTPNYWINNQIGNYINFSSLTSPSATVTGYLPSTVDQNTFSLSNLKTGLDGLVVPLHQPVFAAISNIESKKNCIWTLTLFGNEVVKIQNIATFIWRFADPGEYSLTATVTDVNDNEYTLVTAFNAVHANKIEDYTKYIENTLDRRRLLSGYRRFA